MHEEDETRLGYNHAVPATMLTIIIRSTDAGALRRLDGAAEQARTDIGNSVSVTLWFATGTTQSKLIQHLAGLGIPFESHIQANGRDYLIAGDGRQTSAVETWASTPAEMSVPPVRCDGSVDLVRVRQWEWHCRFLDAVRVKLND